MKQKIEMRDDTCADEILTLAQASDFMKLTPRTLSRLAKGGKVPGVKVGGQYRFVKSRLWEFVGKRWVFEDRGGRQ